MTGLRGLVLSFSACVRALRIRRRGSGMFNNDLSCLQGGKYSRQGQQKASSICLLVYIFLFFLLSPPPLVYFKTVIYATMCHCVHTANISTHKKHTLKIHLTPLHYYTQLPRSQICPLGAASKAYNPFVIECGHPGENNSGLCAAPSALSSLFLLHGTGAVQRARQISAELLIRPR